MSAENQRNLEIVEELRADIDFEIDDVIAQIVRGLPEDYFRMLSRAEQLKHLKALLALNVCDVKDEIRMRSDDGRFIAVVARQDYPGLLANILSQLPAEPPLVGAKIFTSHDHDFIIDLFEFESENTSPDQRTNSALEIEEKILEVTKLTGDNEKDIRGFVGQYHPNSPVFDSTPHLIEQYKAYSNFVVTGETTIEISDDNRTKCCNITIASGSSNVLDVFRTTAKYLAGRGCDITQALLNDFTGKEKRVAVAGIRIENCDSNDSNVSMMQELKARIANEP